MIGSPDSSPFTGSEGFEKEGEEPEAQNLPEELSVRLSPPFSPWTTAAKFHRDFISVAEFSEQVGPKPILTIPNDPKVIGSFDLNHFSVRIMSVDYQASGPGHTSPDSPGPRSNFSEDSRVILGDSADDSFAYVHHLTSYDSEARGMVRPFCMAYVCSDQTKSMENFSESSECFSQASDSSKTGNRQAFSTESQRKSQELEYRRWTSMQETDLQKMTYGSTEVEGKADELEALEHSILNHKDLLRQVTSYPNRKLKQPDFSPYDTADSLTDSTMFSPSEQSSRSLPSSTQCRSEQLLKPLEELCNIYFSSLMKNQSADTEHRSRGDTSVSRTSRVTQLSSRKSKLTNFLFESCCPVDAEEEEEVAQHILGSNRDAVEVQSEKHAAELFSCVKEISIKMEGGEGGRATPDPNMSTDMMGSMSSSDSIEVLGTEKSYQTQQGAVVSNSREMLLGTTETCLRHAAADAGIRHTRASAKRANSEDSIEVLSTTESIVVEDLTAITEEEAEYHPSTNGCEQEEELQVGCFSDETSKEEGMMYSTTSEKQTEEPGGKKEPVEDNSLTENINNVHEDATSEKSLQAELSVEMKPKKLKPVFDLHVKIAPKIALVEVGSSSPPCAPSRSLSVDEVSDCTSFASNSEPPSPTTVNLTKTCVDRRRKRRRAGLRALRFIKQLSFSQNAIFCSSIGRPSVIIGGDEGLVRKSVDGLRLFSPAPGTCGSAVMPCLTTPLQSTDSLIWKLIGIHRSSSSASFAILQSSTQLTRYVASSDLDQKTSRCPSYTGSLVNVSANPHTGISRGITYLSHLESCLTASANQVSLQTFAAASRLPKVTGGHVDTEKDSQGAPRFCSSENDFKVMHFSSDLITQRHTGHGPPVFRFSYSSVQLHRNTYPT